jgi:hypothetical protein
MSKFLCTFSGKFGDILWSLATAKYISEVIVNSRVDFAMMPYYESLVPLLSTQKYIDQAYVIPQWMRTHSNHGDQPWQPPCRQDGEKIKVLRGSNQLDPNAPLPQSISFEEMTYDRAWHLTYKGHPGITAPSMPLIDFVAYQQNISFNNWCPIPFLTSVDCFDELELVTFNSGKFTDVMREGRVVTYAFNEQYEAPKKQFFETLYAEMKGEVEFFNVATAKWKEAAYAIDKSNVFVGCRSANWVLAMGLGKETITYEPHPARSANGHLGQVFGCSHGKEFALPFGIPPVPAANIVAEMLRRRIENKSPDVIQAKSA